MFKKFPRAGERVTASIAPFQLEQNGMSYSWEGVVTRAGAEKPNKRGSNSHKHCNSSPIISVRRRR